MVNRFNGVALNNDARDGIRAWAKFTLQPIVKLLPNILRGSGGMAQLKARKVSTNQEFV